MDRRRDMDERGASAAASSLSMGCCVTSARGGGGGGGGSPPSVGLVGTVSGGAAKCGRWNPTAEQVKVLTDLFRSGLRTPTTDQIQRISSHLSSLGNIESKNVFYWFQNHKARERHHNKKRRRQQVSPTSSSSPPPPPQPQPLSFHDHDNHQQQQQHYLDHQQLSYQNNLYSCSTSTLIRDQAAAVAAAARSMAYTIDFSDQEREIHTLELFPLNSYDHQPLRTPKNDHKDTKLYFSSGKDILLDLRLSSL